MEITIIPRFVEQKVAKSGKVYWQVETTEGERFTIFEKLIYENLCKSINKSVNVDFVEKDDWKNIKEFLGLAPSFKEKPEQIKETPRPKDNSKEALMLTAYAKDLTVAMLAKSEKKEWTAEDMSALCQSAGAMILEVYKDVYSAL